MAALLNMQSVLLFHVQLKHSDSKLEMSRLGTWCAWGYCRLA